MDNIIVNLYEKKEKKLNVSFYLAHHDDETLFYMGLLLFLRKNKNIIEQINIIIFTDILTENTNHDTQSQKLENFKNVLEKLDININYSCLNYSNSIVDDGCEEIKKLNQEIVVITEMMRKLSKLSSSNDPVVRQWKKENVKRLRPRRSKLREKIKNFELKGNLNINYSRYINKLDEVEQQLNSDIIFTHNKLGEYGHRQHKLVNFLIEILKAGRWKNKLIYTPSNCETETCLAVDKHEKQEFIKMYDFKDTKELKNIWFNQTLKNYTHWADNDFEYYSIFS